MRHERKPLPRKSSGQRANEKAASLPPTSPAASAQPRARSAAPQASLIVHRTERLPGRRHVYLYSVEYQGEVIVDRSADAACDAARALQARGITGHVTMLDGVTGKARYIVNIEKAATMTVLDGNRGPSSTRYKPFSRASVSRHSAESPSEGPGELGGKNPALREHSARASGDLDDDLRRVILAVEIGGGA